MVSIVIPTYNREKLIVRSIKSVLCQTYTDIECIVVDDGSTDNTQWVVKNINDSRLRYVKLPKGKGANAARNYGVSLAKGEYIAFQDSDDIWKENKLEKQLEQLNARQADIVSCPYISTKGIDFPIWDNIETSKYLEFLDFFPRNIVSTQTILGKRECFISCPFDNTFPRLQDYELAIRLVTQYKIWFEQEPLVLVEDEGERISSNNQHLVTALKMIFEKVSNMDWDQAQKNEALTRLFNTYMTLAVNSFEDLQKLRDHYENSNSWRITKPLRLIMDFIKRLSQ